VFTAPIPEDDADRLATLYRYSILDTQPEQGFEDVTTLASEICGTRFSLISFVDLNRQWFKSEVGLGSSETGRAESFCACALTSPEPLIVEDTLADPRFAENPLVLGEPGIRFYAGAPLVAPNGHVLGTVCVFDTEPRTISASQVLALKALSRQVMLLLEARLRLLENERAAAALMQQEKLAVVGRLASSMAHEINNPLEAVTNLLWLSQQRSEDGQIKEWLGMADKELRRVSTIANQALRMHKQASAPQLATCDVLFSGVLMAYESRIRNAGIEVEKRKRATEPVVCFEGDVRQALGNVLGNAIDAMSQGGRLFLRSRMGRDWRSGRAGVVLTIADNGTGMSQEVRRRAFEAFFSTKGIGGSGLGLWISAEILQRHLGRILLRSSPRPRRSGTVVTVFLPLEAAVAGPLTVARPLPPFAC
jgi:two-component system NtrC family sensor kinase